MPTNTLQCCVVDDEPLACELIASYIRRTPRLELAGAYTTAKDALEFITTNPIDLVFLDIQMPQMSGIEFARLLPQQTRVVFVTAYSNYAVEGFRVNALDYLMKPVSYDEFLVTIKRALDYVDNTTAVLQQTKPDSEHIMVKSDHKLIRVCISEIEYVESLKDYVKIYIAGQPQALLSLMSLKSIEQVLPEKDFLRVHRSFIVNMARVEVIERSRIVFDRRFVPISDSYRDAFFQALESRNSIINS
jgi:DNA-binding LytR/AlgR family response regulator